MIKVPKLRGSGIKIRKNKVPKVTRKKAKKSNNSKKKEEKKRYRTELVPPKKRKIRETLFFSDTLSFIDTIPSTNSRLEPTIKYTKGRKPYPFMHKTKVVKDLVKALNFL